MKRTGATLPIFKSKRPRQALVAHPNNKGGISQENPKWGAEGSAYKFSSTPHCIERTQSAPTLAHIKAPGSTVEFPGVPEAHSSVAKKTAVQTARTSSTHQAYSFSNHPERGAAYSTGANATATVAGQAHEPSASQSAQLDKSASSLANPRGKPIQKRRVLTATAKGMQHWSKYKHHSQMLFEVFGILCSPPVASGHKAKRFLLQTQDGNINCLFWELDRSLPPLARGRMHRVVGVWSGEKQHLQCYSVRPSRANEEGFVEHAVSASDRSMRQLVAHLTEC